MFHQMASSRFVHNKHNEHNKHDNNSASVGGQEEKNRLDDVLHEKLHRGIQEEREKHFRLGSKQRYEISRLNGMIDHFSPPQSAAGMPPVPDQEN